MNTKSLMTLSAIILALIGISLIFFPKEILDYFELSVSDTLELLMQIIGLSTLLLQCLIGCLKEVLSVEFIIVR